MVRYANLSSQVVALFSRRQFCHLVKEDDFRSELSQISNCNSSFSDQMISLKFNEGSQVDLVKALFPSEGFYFQPSLIIQLWQTF
jgi:hypothetical protein